MDEEKKKLNEKMMLEQNEFKEKHSIEQRRFIGEKERAYKEIDRTLIFITIYNITVRMASELQKTLVL